MSGGDVATVRLGLRWRVWWVAVAFAASAAVLATIVLERERTHARPAALERADANASRMDVRTWDLELALMDLDPELSRRGAALDKARTPSDRRDAARALAVWQAQRAVLRGELDRRTRIAVDADAARLRELRAAAAR